MTALAPALPPEAALPPCDERITAFYRYWISIHPARGVLPGRQHFDPIDVQHLLPALWMVNVHRDPLRFQCRLLGTEQVRIMGRDVTGRWMDEAHPRFTRSASYPEYVAAAKQGEISYRRGPPAFHVVKDYVSMERLVLPLARDGATVDMLLGITVYHLGESRAG